MMVWNYIVIGLGLLLLVFLLVREVRRSRHSRLTMRVVATVLAVGALIGLGLPMSCKRVKERVAVKEVGQPVVKAGVGAIDWKRRLHSGERLQVQGKWMGAPVKLILEGMGQVLDSVKVSADSLFVLRTVPAQMGRAVYRLVAVVGKDTVEREDIPVEVSVRKPLKVLLLASSPNAENTFLVNWLAKNGDGVASRTLVSTDKYQETFANMKARSLDRLAPAVLGEFDVAVVDSGMLAGGGTAGGVGGGLAPLLRRQVAEMGLGLVIRVDSAVGMRKMERVLEKDSLGHVVTASSREGAGKVVMTSRRTYPLLLAGEKEQYAAYWSALLREAARDSRPEVEWNWRPALPRVGEPVLGIVQAGVLSEGVRPMPQGVMGSKAVTVYLAGDGVLPYQWSGRYWPEEAGWQTANILQGDTTWWYVWPAGAWKGVYSGMREKVEAATAQTGEIAGGGKGERDAVEERVAVNKAWFYTLFLLSAIFLWIEKKIL